MTDAKVEAVEFRPMKDGDASAVQDLVQRVFNEHVAPTCTVHGTRKFFEDSEFTSLVDRIRCDHFILLASSQATLVGMIAVKDSKHISLFFVDSTCQRQGIGSELLSRVVNHCKSERPDLGEVTVNSSLNAVDAYVRMGFDATGPDGDADGIRFTPMKKLL